MNNSTLLSGWKKQNNSWCVRIQALRLLQRRGLQAGGVQAGGPSFQVFMEGEVELAAPLHRLYNLLF